MASKVQIVNMALGRIGITQTISSLDEASREAATAKLYFDDAVDYVLADWPWPWATAYGTLALVAGSTTAAANGEWQYAYRYPATALRFRRLVHPCGRTARERLPFTTGRDSSGRLIFTDQCEAEGCWTVRLTNVEEFDPGFVSMLAWKLAADLVAPLGRDAKQVVLCLQAYDLEKANAQADALNETQDDAPRDAEWIEGR